MIGFVAAEGEQKVGTNSKRKSEAALYFCHSDGSNVFARLPAAVFMGGLVSRGGGKFQVLPAARRWRALATAAARRVVAASTTVAYSPSRCASDSA